MEGELVREFVARTTEMHQYMKAHELLGDRGRDALQLQSECARVGCSLLSSEAMRQALLEDAEQLARLAREHQEEVQQVAGHIEYFLEAEGNLLRAAGADDALVARIIGELREASDAARRGQFDLTAFSEALDAARTTTCEIWAELRAGAKDETRIRNRRLRACLQIVCGAAVVGLDASVLTATVGLSAAGMAVSGLLGATVAQNGYELLHPN